MKIDLRSDTVTRPCEGMMKAITNAKVGDDVFGEDPTIKILEEKLAKMLGFEAGIFCPSGTMTNQIAIYNHTDQGDQVICDSTAHIYHYEGGGMAIHSGVSARCVTTPNAKLRSEDIRLNVNPDDFHYPRTTLVALENTTNKGGGSYYTIEEMLSIRKECDRHQLKLHLDGARVFNAIVADNQDPKNYGKIFDTVSVCLSKGLGCPVGSVLLGSKDFILGCYRTRKLLGGGMRQVGLLGAAGIFALDNNIERLAEDHDLCMQIKNIVEEISYVEYILPVKTNIIIFKLKDKVDAVTFLNYLANNNLHAVNFGGNRIRFVTHKDVDASILEPMKSILENYKN